MNFLVMGVLSLKLERAADIYCCHSHKRYMMWGALSPHSLEVVNTV